MLVIEKEIFIFLIFSICRKNGFPIPTAKNGLHILKLHPKKHVISKTNTPFLNANLLEKFHIRKISEIYFYTILSI